MGEILKMRDEIDFSNLTYNLKGPTAPVNCDKFKDPIYIYDHMKNGDKILQQVRNEQKDFLKKLNEITSGNPKYKSKKQLYTIENIRNLYNSRQKVIDLLKDNAKIRSEALHKSKQNETEGKGLKILTPTQMFQRLPIALAQVKAGNNLESLLNEIRQVVYSLYHSKQITKKVYNNIIKSINI